MHQEQKKVNGLSDFLQNILTLNTQKGRDSWVLIFSNIWNVSVLAKLIEAELSFSLLFLFNIYHI